MTLARRPGLQSVRDDRHFLRHHRRTGPGASGRPSIGPRPAGAGARQPQRGAGRLQALDAGRCRPRGGPRRCRVRAGSRFRAAAGPAGIGQGPVRPCRHADPCRRTQAASRFVGGRGARRCGGQERARRCHRQDAHGGVCVRRRRLQPALGHAAQPLGRQCAPRARRLQRRRRRLLAGGHGGCCARLRYRRLGPRACELHRHGRPQDQLQALVA